MSDGRDRMLGRMCEGDSSRWVGNVEAEIFEMEGVPVVVPNTGEENCYVCSLRAHYLPYAREELKALKRPWLNTLACPLFMGVDWLLRWMRSEEVVFLDNWLLSTNLHPEWLAEKLPELVARLRLAYPDRVIVIRSLNEKDDGRLMEVCRGMGFEMMLSRQVYLIDWSEEGAAVSGDLKKDLKLLDRCSYVIESWDGGEDDAERIMGLYGQLYLEKYSQLNPHFTKEWLLTAVRVGFLEVRVFRKEGEIVGVLGFLCEGGVMTAPLVGYDFTAPAKPSLYRLITALYSREGMERRGRMNRSGGADEFKMNRGAKGAWEYSALLVPEEKKRRWGLFVKLVNGVSRRVIYSGA